jgi:hypothetical protein
MRDVRYGRGAGVGLHRGTGVDLGVVVAVGVDVGVAVAVGVGEPEGAQYPAGVPTADIISSAPDDHFVASLDCRMNVSGAWHADDAGGCPTVPRSVLIRSHRYIRSCLRRSSKKKSPRICGQIRWRQ